MRYLESCSLKHILPVTIFISIITFIDEIIPTTSISFYLIEISIFPLFIEKK